MKALAKVKLTMLSLGTLVLGACGDLPPEEQAQFEATLACSDKADSALGIKDEAAGTAAFRLMTNGPTDGDGEFQDRYRTEPNGAFVWEATLSGGDRPLPERLTCRGNATQRTIESIALNDVVKRPSNKEMWKY